MIWLQSKTGLWIFHWGAIFVSEKSPIYTATYFVACFWPTFDDGCSTGEMKNPLNLHFVSLLGHFNNFRTDLLDTSKKRTETTKNLFAGERKTKVAAKMTLLVKTFISRKKTKITKTMVENARTNIFKNG